jgi:MurNAc alpha-1-phosphate uridylyltransferase
MKAMILAAGLGTRMRPLTDHQPKPLLPVAGKPLIAYHLEALVSAGITDIVINISYLGEQIEAYIGDGQRWGASVVYSREASPQETAGGLRQALPLLRAPSVASLSQQEDTSIKPASEPFLVVNGDIWCDYDFLSLKTLAGDFGARLAHVVLVDNPPQHPQGDFYFDAQQACCYSGADFLGKGDFENRADPSDKLTFSGISLISPALLDLDESELRLGPLLKRAMDLNANSSSTLLSAEHYCGEWHDIGTPERLMTLDRQLRAC